MALRDESVAVSGKTWHCFMFILPAFFILSLFWYFPFLWVLIMSWFSWNGIPNNPIVYVGISNFVELFQDIEWWKALWHGAFITIFALTVQNALAFALALACDKDIKAGRFYRVIFFLPPVLSGIVVGLIWKSVLGIGSGQEGLLNVFLGKIGLSFLQREHWLGPSTVLWWIAIINAWKGFGWGFIIFLAGLQNIPRQLYEAAEVDGANSWHKFMHITLPLMIPVIFMVIILTILGCMQMFDIVYAFAKDYGDISQVPVKYLIFQMRGMHRLGYTTALALILGLLLVVVSFIQVKVSRRLKRV